MFENYNVPKELKPSDPRFGCGPSLIPVEFLKSLAETGTELLGTSHRKPAVKNLVKEVREGLMEYFNLPEDSICFWNQSNVYFESFSQNHSSNINRILQFYTFRLS